MQIIRVVTHLVHCPIPEQHRVRSVAGLKLARHLYHGVVLRVLGHRAGASCRCCGSAASTSSGRGLTLDRDFVADHPYRSQLGISAGGRPAMGLAAEVLADRAARDLTLGSQ